MDINGTDRCLGCMQDKAGAVRCPHCGRDERSAASPPPCLPLGIRLNDQYILGRMLGHGGFGITYLAWDCRLERPVAIKEYLPREYGQRAADGRSFSCYQGEAAALFHNGRRRFLEEARNLARFGEHPGIVTVLAFFSSHGMAYMVMQYVQGMDLRHYVDRMGGRLAPAQALRVMTPVLDGLRAMHAADLLHRDVSPDNIYITRCGRVLILDFGAARQARSSHSQSRTAVRKPGYSPEEQYRPSGRQGPWTDVYAAAATLYRLITGIAPPDAMERLADDRLPTPSGLGIAMDPVLERVLLKALAVRAADRLQSIEALQQAMGGLSSARPRAPLTLPAQPGAGPAPGDPIDAPTAHPNTVSQSFSAAIATPPNSSARRPGGGSRRLIALAAPVVIAAIATVGWLWHQHAAEQDRRTAQPESTRQHRGPATQDRPAPRNTRLFRTEYTPDGFVALRTGPTPQAELIERIPGGTRLRCRAATNGDGWRYCADAGGWVHAGLLIPTLDDSDQTDRYRVIPTAAGFIDVRSRPTSRDGESVARLYTGHRVYCERASRGQGPKTARRWLNCPEAGGWIDASLLRMD